ncbi:MAG: hypothetical protein AAF577_10040 [Pseudomonadota bacterium]
MRLDAPRQARDVIDDDDMGVMAMVLQEGEHRIHARPRDQAAGFVVTEDLDDLQTIVAGVVAATGLL